MRATFDQALQVARDLEQYGDVELSEQTVDWLVGLVLNHKQIPDALEAALVRKWAGAWTSEEWLPEVCRYALDGEAVASITEIPAPRAWRWDVNCRVPGGHGGGVTTTEAEARAAADGMLVAHGWRLVGGIALAPTTRLVLEEEPAVPQPEPHWQRYRCTHCDGVGMISEIVEGRQRGRHCENCDGRGYVHMEEAPYDEEWNWRQEDDGGWDDGQGYQG